MSADSSPPPVPSPTTTPACKHCGEPERRHDKPVFASGIRRCPTLAAQGIEAFFGPASDAPAPPRENSQINRMRDRP